MYYDVADRLRKEATMKAKDQGKETSVVHARIQKGGCWGRGYSPPPGKSQSYSVS